MKKLSVSIITFNEEKNIRRCLESVSTLADEIVVVDSFSTDKTEAICREFDVKFSTHIFEGHIEQKNIALAYCSNPVVLAVDADEALSEKLLESIKIEKEKGFPHPVYSMNRLTNYCGKWIRHCGWYPDRKLRLFHKSAGKWGGENPHDQLILKEKVSAFQLTGDLLHYSYYTQEEHFKQVEYFTTIGAATYHKKGKKAGCLKMYGSPVAKFLRDYIFKLGFLDGKSGFQVCYISAGATFTKYKKLRALNQENKAGKTKK